MASRLPGFPSSSILVVVVVMVVQVQKGLENCQGDFTTATFKSWNWFHECGTPLLMLICQLKST